MRLEDDNDVLLLTMIGTEFCIFQAKAMEEIKALQNFSEMTKRLARDTTAALAEAKSQVDHLSQTHQVY